MRLQQKDIESLYYEVEDLTNNFAYFNPAIFLENKVWFKILEFAQELKTIKELVPIFGYTECGMRLVLNKMRFYGLVSNTRTSLLDTRWQQCPYEWTITSFGRKILRHSLSSYKASQRLFIFRCITGMDSASFASLFNRKASVINNWETGCRFIESIKTAQEYMTYLQNNIQIGEVNLSLALKGFGKIKAWIKERRAEVFRNMTFEECSARGKISGKLGDKKKKRANIMRSIAKQPPTRYERKIIKFFEDKNISYDLHPVICKECFDFKVANFIIEAEEKRGLGQSYYKAFRMNKKARKVKNSFSHYKFVAIIPANTSPEVIKKLSEEYITCIYPQEDKLEKYINILSLINKGLNEPKVKRALFENINAIHSRFNKLTQYNLLRKSQGTYRNSWDLTDFGRKFLMDYQSLCISSLYDLLDDKILRDHNNSVQKLIAMRYWFFVNPSGHITKMNYLNAGEVFIKSFFQERYIPYHSQYLIKNNIHGYEIGRLFDGFILPNTIIEIKTINTDSKNVFNLSGGQLVELAGQAMVIRDFHPNFKIIGILLGKSENINNLPQATNNILSAYVDKIYTIKDITDLQDDFESKRTKSKIEVTSFQRAR